MEGSGFWVTLGSGVWGYFRVLGFGVSLGV